MFNTMMLMCGFHFNGATQLTVSRQSDGSQYNIKDRFQREDERDTT